MSLSDEKIGIDVDETLARTVEDWVYPIVNAKYWTNFSFETTLNYRDVFWNILKNDWDDLTLQQKIDLFKCSILQDFLKNKIRPVSWSCKMKSESTIIKKALESRKKRKT